MSNCGGCKDPNKKPCQKCQEASKKKPLMSEWLKEEGIKKPPPVHTNGGPPTRKK